MRFTFPHPRSRQPGIAAEIVRIQALAAKAGVADRVDFIDGGDLLALLAGAMGAIVVNSAVGLHALQAGCPVKSLGMATCDMPGITHQGPLAGFWSDPVRPEPADVASLVRRLRPSFTCAAISFHPRGARRRSRGPWP